MKRIILLGVSYLLLLTSVGIFVYLKNQNNLLDNNIIELKENIKKVNERIKDSKEEKEEKDNEYEKLKEELKEKIEELGIWEETKEKLHTELS